MDIKMFNISKDVDIKKIKNKFLENFYYSEEKQQCGIFHINEVQEDVYHMVYYIDDEYRTGTKLMGDVNTFKLDIYVNVFVFLKFKVVVIENIHKNYIDLVNEKLSNLLNYNLIDKTISYAEFKSIILNFSRKVKKLEYEIDDNIEVVEDKESALKLLMTNDIDIKFITVTPEIQDYYSDFVSVKRNGKISISSKTPLAFIRIFERLLKNFE